MACTWYVLRNHKHDSLTTYGSSVDDPCLPCCPHWCRCGQHGRGRQRSKSSACCDLLDTCGDPWSEQVEWGRFNCDQIGRNMQEFCGDFPVCSPFKAWLVRLAHAAVAACNRWVWMWEVAPGSACNQRYLNFTFIDIPPPGCVWKCRVPHCTQWFCWSLSLWKMASYHWED